MYEFEMIGELVGKARPRMNTRTGKIGRASCRERVFGLV